MNFAVVTVVLTGMNAAQCDTFAEADETTAITASAMTATARMIFFKRYSCFYFRQPSDRLISDRVPMPHPVR